MRENDVSRSCSDVRFGEEDTNTKTGGDAQDESH